MAVSTDWEDLMNGVFGPGGRFRGAGGEKRQPDEGLAAAQKKLEEAAARTQTAADAARHTDGARLLKNSEELTKRLEAQSREISRLGQGLAREMERDGLLTPAQAATAAPAPKDTDAAFEAAAKRQRAALAGRQAFSAALLAAFRRPFVLGQEGEKPRNVIVLSGRAALRPHRDGAGPERRGPAGGGRRMDGPGPLRQPGAGKAFFAGPLRHAGGRRPGAGL